VKEQERQRGRSQQEMVPQPTDSANLSRGDREEQRKVKE
jgi:hypothetical protein